MREPQPWKEPWRERRIAGYLLVVREHLSWSVLHGGPEPRYRERYAVFNTEVDQAGVAGSLELATSVRHAVELAEQFAEEVAAWRNGGAARHTVDLPSEPVVIYDLDHVTPWPEDGLLCVMRTDMINKHSRLGRLLPTSAIVPERGRADAVPGARGRFA